jgi:acyl-CoA thioester hydrolase
VQSNDAFSWPVRVYYEDSDAQGLVYYANYFKFMERARTEWIRTLGVEQDVLLREQRRLFVVVKTDAEFVQPARFNDQLVVTAALLERARASFLLEQRIHREHLDGDLICRGTPRAAYINADTMKPARLPDTLFEGPET